MPSDIHNNKHFSRPECVYISFAAALLGRYVHKALRTLRISFRLCQK